MSKENLVSEMNISQMKVNEYIDLMVLLYASCKHFNYNLDDGDGIPSQMLWGAPGIGKSAIPKTIAKKLKEITKKEVYLTDFRLPLHNISDLLGIPVADAKRELSIWLRPKVLKMNESPDVINILFLDELPNAMPSVQTAALQLTLDRRVGDHEIPDNCIIIAAGNRK